MGVARHVEPLDAGPGGATEGCGGSESGEEDDAPTGAKAGPESALEEVTRHSSPGATTLHHSSALVVTPGNRGQRPAWTGTPPPRNLEGARGGLQGTATSGQRGRQQSNGRHRSRPKQPEPNTSPNRLANLAGTPQPPQPRLADRSSSLQPPARQRQRQLWQWMAPMGIGHQQQRQQQPPPQLGRSPEAAPLTSCSRPVGREHTFPGIANLGNTCFLSALLQGLASVHLPSLEGEAESTSPLDRLLRQVLLDLRTPREGPLHCNQLWDYLVRRHPHLGHNLQQDLFEGWQAIAGAQSLAGPFALRRRWRTTCAVDGAGCGYCGERVDSSNVWPMPLVIGPQGGARGAEHLIHLEHTRAQHLPDWRCPCCDGLGGRQSLVARSTPPCVLLQVLRFEAGPGGLRKLHAPFPVPWEGLRIAALGDGAVEGLAYYRLLAVLLHDGELAGGHYRALALRRGDWFCMDDSSSSRLSGGFPAGSEQQVYGLLLQRRD